MGKRNTASAEPEQAAEASTAAAEPNAAGVLWPLPRRIPPGHIESGENIENVVPEVIVP